MQCLNSVLDYVSSWGPSRNKYNLASLLETVIIHSKCGLLGTILVPQKINVITGI